MSLGLINQGLAAANENSLIKEQNLNQTTRNNLSPTSGPISHTQNPTPAPIENELQKRRASVQETKPSEFETKI